MFTNSKTFTTVSHFKISELLQGAKLAWLVMPVSYQSHLYLHNEKTTTRETGCLFYPVTNSASTFHQIKVGVLNCPNQTKKPVLAIISLAQSTALSAEPRLCRTTFVSFTAYKKHLKKCLLYACLISQQYMIYYYKIPYGKMSGECFSHTRCDHMLTYSHTTTGKHSISKYAHCGLLTASLGLVLCTAAKNC